MVIGGNKWQIAARLDKGNGIYLGSGGAMPKGNVRVESVRGNLRLRWRWEGSEYVVPMGFKDTAIARKVAESKAAGIENDLITGNFDRSLAKYKPGTPEKGPEPLKVVEVFDRYRKKQSVGLSKTGLQKYAAVRSKLAIFFGDAMDNLDPSQVAGFCEWVREEVKPGTAKEYLNLIAGGWEWAIKQGLSIANPWAEAPGLVSVPPQQRPRPFTDREIASIMRGFTGDRYYAYYADFVAFQFGTGCRQGEAIALQWKHLTDDCGMIWIGESMAGKTRKATKTNRSREFRLSDQTQAMLLKRRPDRWDMEGLVFPAKKGGPIDSRNFRNRAWVKVLRIDGIPYRKPYNTRHTFISHALKQGTDPMTIAYMTGHDPETLFKYYAAYIQADLQCPTIVTSPASGIS